MKLSLKEGAKIRALCAVCGPTFLLDENYRGACASTPRKQGITDEAAIKKGLEQKSEEFAQSGSEVDVRQGVKISCSSLVTCHSSLLRSICAVPISVP